MNRSQRIDQCLKQEFAPLFLSVENESHKHHVPDGSETHFKVVIVSNLFQDLSLIKRHRLVNKLLADELNQGLHALSLHLYTPAEWDSRQTAPASPACRDGYQYG